MKALFYRQYGGSEVLEYGEAPRPVPGPRQVLVKVAATSFNPVDAGIRGGYLSEVYAITFPHVPGIDVAGTIAELGDDGQGWNVGDAVVALLPLDADGAVAEVEPQMREGSTGSGGHALEAGPVPLGPDLPADVATAMGLGAPMNRLRPSGSRRRR
jgi:NADPH:quinone reductase-like Zn-dependent oxidoreductase